MANDKANDEEAAKIAADKAAENAVDEAAGQAAAQAADGANEASEVAAEEPAAPVEHKRFKVLCARERSVGEIVDRVFETMLRDHVAPADGFAVSAESADDDLPARIVVSFDPDNGAIDRELVRESIEARVTAALKA